MFSIRHLIHGIGGRKNSEPMLFEERKPFIPVRKSFVFDKFAKEDVTSDGTQSKGDGVKDQPEDDVLSRYFGPVFL